MKNTFGNNLTVTVFGESHGDAVGCVIDGLSPGVRIDTDYIKEKMRQRQARGGISTPRQEPDEVVFLSGVKGGFSEGSPICLIIKNTNTKSSAYDALEFTPRPSHADLTAEYKYHGFQDKRGGGHFSGRVTAAIVAAGSIIRLALEEKGIFIGSHIKYMRGISDRGFSDYALDIAALNSDTFPTLDGAVGERMIEEITSAREAGDSVGGILESAVIGMPVGCGEPFFDSVESVISHAVFSVGGVKGIEFGAGFALADMRGSEANDPLCQKNGRIVSEKNSSGGVLGGITSGMPITFSTVIKPTPSISLPQRSVDLRTMENTEISVVGRHDPAIIHRARAVVDAVVAIALGDLLITRFGEDYLGGEK